MEKYRAKRIRIPYRQVFCNTTELVLGFLFVTAAISKVIRGESAIQLVTFLLSNSHSASYVLYTVIGIEWLLGLCLIAGVARKYTIPATIILLVVFSSALAVAGYRDYAGSCGCFALAESVQHAAIRNVFLTSISIGLLWLSEIQSHREIGRTT